MTSLLERTVALALYLQGIGSGAKVNSSGEAAVLSKLGSQKDLCIFDVGANTGQFLTLARKALRDRKFHVHSFEPSRAAFEQLRENARDCSNVSLNHFGLGAEAGEFDLFSDAPGSQLASLTRRNLDHLGIAMQMTEKVRDRKSVV